MKINEVSKRVSEIAGEELYSTVSYHIQHHTHRDYKDIECEIYIEGRGLFTAKNFDTALALLEADVIDGTEKPMDGDAPEG